MLYVMVVLYIIRIIRSTGAGGVTCFIVEKGTPGLTFGAKEKKVCCKNDVISGCVLFSGCVTVRMMSLVGVSSVVMMSLVGVSLIY